MEEREEPRLSKPRSTESTRDAPIVRRGNNTHHISGSNRYQNKNSNYKLYIQKVRGDIRINFPTPSAPYDPQMLDIPLTPISKNPSHSSEINQETTRLNQLLESNMRDRTNSINDAINFNQLMGFDNTEVTQNILEDYLMSAMEMEDTHYNGVNIL